MPTSRVYGTRHEQQRAIDPRRGPHRATGRPGLGAGRGPGADPRVVPGDRVVVGSTATSGSSPSGAAWQIPERIVTLDPLLRRFQYEMRPADRPIPPRDPRRASSSTRPAAWSSTAPTPSRPTMALIIGGAAGAGLLRLGALLEGGLTMGRKILFVTTDQQRYDTLGCNGGTLARTPVIDGLAAEGIRYERAHPQSVVCMPSRATMLTGQYPTTHGVWMNGVPLPIDAPSVAEELRGHGYRTALVGKAHFEPFLDPFLRFPENAQAQIGTVPPGGAHRGFEHLELATHGSVGPLHYARWLAREHPEAVGGFYRALDCVPPGQRRGRRRHRGAPGEGQPGRAWHLPHRLGRRPDDRLARRTRGRRRLVLLDELPGPPPPLGPAPVRGGPDRLARGAAAGRVTPSRSTSASASSTASPATGGSGTTGPLVSNYEAPARLGPRHADRRPGPRGERPQRGGVRADRRGARTGHAAHRRAGVGRRRRRRLHERPRRAAGRLRPPVQGPVPRRRADAAPARVAAGPLGGDAAGGRDPAGRAGRPGSDLLRHRRDRARRVDAGAADCRSTTPTRTAAGSTRSSPSGTASSSEWASTSGASIRDGIAVHRLRRRAPSTTAPRESSTPRPRTPPRPSTGGTTGRGGPSATSSSASSRTIAPPSTSRAFGSRPRSEPQKFQYRLSTSFRTAVHSEWSVSGNVQVER